MKAQQQSILVIRCDVQFVIQFEFDIRVSLESLISFSEVLIQNILEYLDLIMQFSWQSAIFVAFYKYNTLLIDLEKTILNDLF